MDNELVFIQTWPDCAVRKEIEKLQVTCENAEYGCDWQGLFRRFLVSK